MIVGKAVDNIVESSAHNTDARHKPGKMAQNCQPCRLVGFIRGGNQKFLVQEMKVIIRLC